MIITIHFDGACNNQLEIKPMGIGVAVFFDDQYDPELSRAIGLMTGWEKDISTSNIAEFIGCVEAMKMAKDLRKVYPQAKIEVYSDSQFVSNIFNGQSQIRDVKFNKYLLKARYFAHGTGVKRIHWIQRELNKKADKLSKEGIKIAA